MRKLLIALVVFPMVALAQGAGTPAPKPPQNAPPAPQQQSQAGPGQRGQRGQGRMDPQRFERRMRLARTLGLAEALDLEPADALKLGDQLSKNDEKRLAIRQQTHDANQVLRRAASGQERVTTAEVDGAIQRVLQGRQQLEQLDREAVQTLVKDLTPEKRARAMLFLERFRSHFARRGGMMMRGGPGGPGEGPGMGGMHGMHGMMNPGPGMGHEGMGKGAGVMADACPDCPWGGPPAFDEDDD
jgi:hypothetical protein